MKRKLPRTIGAPVCNRLFAHIYRKPVANRRSALQFVLIIGLIAGACSTLAETPKLTPQQTEFFEKKVQPILSTHCYDCHSHASEKIRGALVLDTREGLLKGGENGPAILPGNAEKSLLIAAVRYTNDDLQMPPKGKKLSDAQIATLEEWVKMGAPDPREGKAYSPVDVDAARAHWAFTPVEQPPVPKVKNRSWVKTPVDNFILARLEENKFKPSAPTDKRTLIRRATFDLIGLPPTPAEVDAFIKDRSPDAFAKVVDHLLASPHYGERWGRHWLDVARYADTKGDQGNRGAETRFVYAYTYRDYVIRSFNEDKPFNQFVIEQIAADKLQLGDDKRPLAALGFLTVGNRFRNAVNEVIDDQIDVVTRGLMGVTVSCARCHDHKFDPIPTADYYSLHGIFVSTTEPAELPAIEQPKNSKAYADFKKQLAAAESALEIAREKNEQEIRSIIRNKVGEYLLATFEISGTTNISKNVFYSSRKLSTAVGGKWERALRKWKDNRVFAPWIALSKLPEKDFAKLAPKTLSKFKADEEINSLVLDVLFASPLKSIEDTAERYGKLFEELDKKLEEAEKNPRIAKTGLGDGEEASVLDSDWQSLEETLNEKGAPADIEAREVRGLTSQQTDRKLNELIRKVNDIKIKHPASPAHALAVEDITRPRDSYVFLRGNAGSRGPVVPRQFLEILSEGKRKPFRDGSGRLELAQHIASDENPLTPRVIVNRVWLHHFGEGIVATPSDFGLRSEPPSHPELLNYLAARLKEGWSLKKLHRLIMLSNVYQQKSDDNAAYAKIDPGNRLLWRANRLRLDFEAMRDTILASSGALDRKVGGQSAELLSEPASARRTVYGWIDRQDVPGVLLNFDFANPDMSSPQRYTTTVPQQALFLMNSPFVIEQARALMQRKDLAGAKSDDQKIKQLYAILFQREPDRDEVQAGLKFLKAAAEQPVERIRQPGAWKYGFGKVNSSLQELEQFSVLDSFSSEAWRMKRGASAKPLVITATGGKTDDKLGRVAVRRWTAPFAGLVSIEGALKHGNAKGAGVTGRIIQNRKNSLGEWTAKNSKTNAHVARVKVKAGDTIDFVTSSVDESDGEPFTWSPIIRLLEPNPNETPGLIPEWNAEADFAGPNEPEMKERLNAWARYAQVLLLSNEIVFLN